MRVHVFAFLLLIALAGGTKAALAETVGLALVGVNPELLHTVIEKSSVSTAPEIRKPDLASLCMAAALYHEARGESTTGQLAVARVILNRARSRAYPDSICGVVYQNAERANRCQFSFACDGLSDYPRNPASLLRIAELTRAIFKEKATDRLLPDAPRERRHADFDKITHYHTDYVNPSWGRKIDRIGKIGGHIFYRSDRVARSL